MPQGFVVGVSTNLGHKGWVILDTQLGKERKERRKAQGMQKSDLVRELQMGSR